MRLRKYSFSLLIALLLVSSCRVQRDGMIYQNVEPEDIQAGIIGDESFEMEIAYVGAIGHSFIYECYFKNTGEQPIVIDKSNFYMEHGDGQIIFPSEGYAIAEQLEQEQKDLKKEKKRATTAGIIGVGLTALIGASTGAPVGETLLFSAEPIAYIFDDRRWYNKGIESIEDENEYVRNAQFNHQKVLPGQEMTRDLLFATTKIKSDVTLHYTHVDFPYSVTFPKKVFR